MNNTWTHCTLTVLYVGCVRFLIPLWRLLFSHFQLVHQLHLLLQLLLLYCLLVSHTSSYQPSWSCHLPHLFPSSHLSFLSPPFPSLLPRSVLPVLFSAHCPASPAPSFPPHSFLFLLSFLFPPLPPHLPSSSMLVLVPLWKWFFFYKITTFPQRNICMSFMHVIVRECCPS